MAFHGFYEAQKKERLKQEKAFSFVLTNKRVAQEMPNFNPMSTYEAELEAYKRKLTPNDLLTHKMLYLAKLNEKRPVVYSAKLSNRYKNTDYFQQW